MWYDLYRQCNRHGVALMFRPSEYYFSGADIGVEFEFIKGCHRRFIILSLELYTPEEVVERLHRELVEFLKDIPEPRLGKG